MIETKVINHPNGGVEKILVDNSPVDKAVTERAWRDSELLRTDNWPIDRPPGGQIILDYRVELRSYPDIANFPNGARPTL